MVRRTEDRPGHQEDVAVSEAVPEQLRITIRSAAEEVESPLRIQRSVTRIGERDDEQRTRLDTSFIDN